MKNFIRLSDSAVVTEADIDPRMVVPNPNFQPSLSLYAPIVAAAKPPYDPLTHAADEAQPALVDGVWTQQWSVRALTQEQQDAIYAASVPQAVTMRQARRALLGAGMLTAVEAAIDGMAEPAKSAARIEWEYSSEVQRNNGLVAQLAPVLGLTSQQVDALFIAAAAL